jgi:hypothetical protein
MVMSAEGFPEVRWLAHYVPFHIDYLPLQQVVIKEQAAQLAAEYASRLVVAKFYRQVADLSQELLDKQLASDEEDFVE